MRAALAALGLTAALAGCGGEGSDGPSDSEQVRTVAQAYLTAVADKDWKAVCATRSQHDLDELAAQGGCEATFAKLLGGEDVELFRTARLGAVHVRGDVAGVGLSSPDSTSRANTLGKLAAVREDGDWRLEDIPEDEIP